jgi:hypothetical protein
MHGCVCYVLCARMGYHNIILSTGTIGFVTNNYFDCIYTASNFDHRPRDRFFEADVVEGTRSPGKGQNMKINMTGTA